MNAKGSKGMLGGREVQGCRGAELLGKGACAPLLVWKLIDKASLPNNFFEGTVMLCPFTF